MKHRNLSIMAGAVLLLVAVALWLSKTTAKTPESAGNTVPGVTVVKPRKNSEPARLAVPGKAVNAARPAAALASRELILGEIEDASVSYDAKELPRIAPYLLNADPAVREAARNGMVNLGDAAAGPLLRKASQSAPTPQEAVALIEAADFVELPSGSAILKKDGLKELRGKVGNPSPHRKPPPPAAQSPAPTHAPP